MVSPSRPRRRSTPRAWSFLRGSASTSPLAPTLPAGMRTGTTLFLPLGTLTSIRGSPASRRTRWSTWLSRGLGTWSTPPGRTLRRRGTATLPLSRGTRCGCLAESARPTPSTTSGALTLPPPPGRTFSPAASSSPRPDMTTLLRWWCTLTARSAWLFSAAETGRRSSQTCGSSASPAAPGPCLQVRPLLASALATPQQRQAGALSCISLAVTSRETSRPGRAGFSRRAVSAGASSGATRVSASSLRTAAGRRYSWATQRMPSALHRGTGTPFMPRPTAWRSCCTAAATLMPRTG
mmetsp:Transcript_1016/g.2419  ORF Transcript_1016/g.2419 Transcript_1016/m.2419 type:complete len:294 (-) Transcript_1016:388-1269(-)